MCMWELGVKERGGGWGVRRLIDELILLMWGFPNHCLLAYISLGCLDFPLR